MSGILVQDCKGWSGFLTPSYFDTRGDLVELWLQFDFGYSPIVGYDTIPVPVFTEWWDEK